MAKEHSQSIYSAVSGRSELIGTARHSLFEYPEGTAKCYRELTNPLPGSPPVGRSLVVGATSVSKHGTCDESERTKLVGVGESAYISSSAEKLSGNSEQFLVDECVSSETSDVDALVVSLNGLRLVDPNWVVGWILAVDPTSVLGSARYSYGLRATCVIHGYCCPVLVDVPRSSRNGLDDVVGAPLPELRWEMDCSDPGVDILEQFLRFMVAELAGVSVKLSKWKMTEPDRVVFERLDILLNYKPLLKMFRERIASLAVRDHRSVQRTESTDGTVPVELTCEEQQACELLNIDI